MTSGEVDRALALPLGEREQKLLTLVEDQWFERKSGRVAPKDIAEPLVAFANADGGVIVVGLHGGEVDGVAPRRVNDLRQAALDFTQPPVRTTVEELPARKTDGAEVSLVVLRVEQSDHVHRTNSGACYLRVGDESRKLSPAMERELMFDRGAAVYDATPIDLCVEDLDQEQLSAYSRIIGAESIEGMLAARDLVDRRGRLTVAAALLFDQRPQREFPNAVVRVLRYASNERGMGRDMTLEEGHDVRLGGSLPTQIFEAASVIERLMPQWRQLQDSGLFEATTRIPKDAWLEGLVNAVVHRSYSAMGDHIRVEIFPNRIEISSPGRFPGLADPRKPMEITRFARNPRIARVCADMGITRELGEGIKRMFREMRSRGLTDPVYEQSSGAVHLTLMAVDALPPDVLGRLTPSARKILDALRLAGRPQGTGQLAEAAGVTRMTATRALGLLQDEGIVTWQGMSARDPRATWRLG